MLGFSPISGTPLAALHGDMTYAVPIGAQAQFYTGETLVSASSSVSAIGELASFSLGTPLVRVGKTAYPFGLSSVFRVGQVSLISDALFIPTGVESQFLAGVPTGSVRNSAHPVGVHAIYSLGSTKLFQGVNVTGAEAKFTLSKVKVTGVNNVFVHGVEAKFSSGTADIVAVSTIRANGVGAHFYLNDVGVVVHAEANVDATLNLLRFSVPKVITWGDITSCRDTHNEWKDIPT